MIEVSKRQRENALFARDVLWPSVPKKNVYRNLFPWRSDPKHAPTCKTKACFGGWVSVHPYFTAQGVTSVLDGLISLRDGRRTLIGVDVSEALFGTPGLFYARYADEGDEPRISAHAIVARRLDRLIRESVVLTDKERREPEHEN